VIAMTGGRDPKTKFRKVYQEVDDVPAFEPVTKFNATVDDVARFPDMVRQAFRVATSGTPGPVHLQFRGNEGQLDLEEAEMEPLSTAVRARAAVPAGARTRRAKLARRWRAAGGRAAGDRRRRRRARLGPAARTGRAGREAADSGRDLAQRQGCDPRQPSAVGRRRRHLFARSANRVVNEADLVCFIGSETGGMTTHFWQVPKIGTPRSRSTSIRLVPAFRNS
jgi:acetolactate synthase I/II/III large subunit